MDVFGNETRICSYRQRFPDRFWRCDIGVSLADSLGGNPEDLDWSSGQPQDISSRRPATRQFAYADCTQEHWIADVDYLGETSVRQR